MGRQTRDLQQGDSRRAKSRREGRGKLSTIAMLPEAADEHIAWANQALREEKLPQTVILEEFNERLLDLGLKPVSKGAFSRWSVRLALEARKIDASRQIAETVLGRMAPGDRTDATLAAIELLKHRILTMVVDTDEPDLKLFGEAALAIRRLSSTALGEAEGQRKEKAGERADDKLKREAEREREKREVTETAATVEKIAAEAGLSADRIAAIRKGVLGLSA